MKQIDDHDDGGQWGIKRESLMVGKDLEILIPV